MMFFWPFVLIGLVVLVIWMIRGEGSIPMMGCMMGHGNMAHGEQTKTALDVVRERYARGEIDREEYEQKLRDLS